MKQNLINLVTMVEDAISKHETIFISMENHQTVFSTDFLPDGISCNNNSLNITSGSDELNIPMNTITDCYPYDDNSHIIEVGETEWMISR